MAVYSLKCECHHMQHRGDRSPSYTFTTPQTQFRFWFGVPRHFNRTCTYMWRLWRVLTADAIHLSLGHSERRLNSHLNREVQPGEDPRATQRLGTRTPWLSALFEELADQG